MTTKQQITREVAKHIGEQLGITWNAFDVDQFRIGMEVEIENGKRG